MINKFIDQRKILNITVRYGKILVLYKLNHTNFTAVFKDI